MSDDVRNPGRDGGLGLADLRVRADSPTGIATAELVGHELRLTFAAGAYHRADERDLEREGAHLCRVLWKGYAQQVNELVARSGGTTMNLQAATHPRDVEFAQRLARITAQGRDAGGRVTVEAVGMREWTVRIADGTVTALPEEEFVAAVAQAARALIADQLAKVAVLRYEIYRPR